MAKLIIVSGPGVGRELPLGANNVLGRQESCDIVLPDESISRNHARIFMENESYFVEDLGSTNGTFVNGKLAERLEIHHHDTIRAGNFMFNFQTEQEQPDSRLGRTMISFTPEDFGPSTVVDVIEATDYDLDAEAAALAEKQDVQALQQRLSVINTIAGIMATSLDADEILQKVVESLFEVFTQAQRAFVMLLDESTKELVPKAVKFAPGKEESELQVSRTIVNTCMDDCASVLSTDAAQDERFKSGQSIVDLGLHSVMCAPIIYQGELLGIVHVDTTSMTRSFTNDDLALLTATSSQVALVLANVRMHKKSIKQERIAHDLRFAKTVQESFLPLKLPETPGYQFHAFYVSAYDVGGDFYDVIDLGDGKLCVVIGDVSGKGIGAALVMARMTSEVRTYAHRGLSPEETITKINAAMDWMLESRFITIFYALLDTTSGALAFVNGGHGAPIVRRADGKIELFEEPCNFPLGVDGEAEFEGGVITIAPGDLIYLCTDGVIEALSEQEECYGTERLVNVLTAAEGSPKDVTGAVLSDVRAFTAGATQSDDLTMLTLLRT